MTNQELISKARQVINPHKTEDGRRHGDVGAALIGRNGKLYVGTCVDTPSWGLCAERSAIAAMITDGEYKIEKIVSVWKDDNTQKLYVVPPCGICREFMKQIDQQNLDIEVLLNNDISRNLKDLLPFHQWPEPLN